MRRCPRLEGWRVAGVDRFSGSTQQYSTLIHLYFYNTTSDIFSVVTGTSLNRTGIRVLPTAPATS
jgi:hypothetical protein